MKHYIFFFIILALCILPGKITGTNFEDKKEKFHITILNTEGESQVGMIMKIGSYATEYVSDEEGTVEFEQKINEKDIRTANFYFPSDKKKSVKALKLDKTATDTILRIDSPQDLIRFKQSGKTFCISGIIKNAGKPVKNAEVSIQGTGRNTFSDAQGCFTIEADYNHTIMIRAEKMENLYIEADRFLQNPDKPYPILMTRKGSDRIYTSVEQMPEYPGGMKAFFNYIQRKAHTTEHAMKAQKEGTVMIQFIVEKDGSITSPHIVRGFDEKLDTVALDAIISMRDWLPAKDHGTVVRCKYSVPVSFKLPKPETCEEKPSVKTSAKNDTLHTDSVMTDSIANDSLTLTPNNMRDSLMLQKDSLTKLQLKADSLRPVPDRDSLNIQTADSLKTDSLTLSAQPQTAEVKPKKRNAFVRFFRWLFGIKDKDEKKDETKAKETGQPATDATSDKKTFKQ